MSTGGSVVNIRADIRKLFLDLGAAIGLCILLFVIMNWFISGYQEFCYHADLVQKLYFHKQRNSTFRNTVQQQPSVTTVNSELEGFETNR